MVYLKSVENVITLGKLIGLLFLFCLPLLSILFLKERPRSPCNGNHFSSLGILWLIHQYRNQLKPLFLATGKPKVIASAVLAMFKVQWSPQGSNQKESEEAVILGWNEYVHDLEGMLLYSDYKTLLYPSKLS